MVNIGLTGKEKSQRRIADIGFELESAQKMKN
jgi:hypothetical protein